MAKTDTTKRSVDLAEPILSLVREILPEKSGADATTDAAVRPLKSLALLLDLYRPPEYAVYKPSAIFKDRNLEDDLHVVKQEPVEDCVGDARQVADCVQILMRGAELMNGSVLVAELFQQPDPPVMPGPVPCIGLGFDGPGRFPAEFVIDNAAAVSQDEIRLVWTLATRGGRIDAAPNGLLLRLQGRRVPQEPTNEYEPLRTLTEAALNKAESGDATGALAAVDEALALFDAPDRPPEPADFVALINEVRQEHQTQLQSGDVSVEIVVSTAPPPIPMRRPILKRLLANIFRMGIEFATPGGAIIVLIDYNAASRATEIIATITGNGSTRLSEAYAASCRRALQIHSGACEFAESPRELTMSFTLPDTVGRELDQWLPAWDAFAERSQKELRLIKSGGEGIPQDVLLEGVLEEELERWLLPMLDKPPAVNVAHETSIPQHPHPSSSPDRLKKALDQIKKGKPRRELAKPLFAAELIYAFRTGQRTRAAIGATTLSAEDMAQLAQWLWQSPPPYINCLRTVARILESSP